MGRSQEIPKSEGVKNNEGRAGVYEKNCTSYYENNIDEARGGSMKKNYEAFTERGVYEKLLPAQGGQQKITAKEGGGLRKISELLSYFDPSPLRY